MTRRLFWPAVAVGWALVAVGVVGVLGEGRDVPIAAFGRWLVASALVHDLVLAPVVLAVGVGLRAVLGPPWRAIAGATLIVLGPVVLFAWPYVAGWGRSGSNPSIQPRDYGEGLAIIVASVGVAAVLGGLAVIVGRARAR